MKWNILVTVFTLFQNYDGKRAQQFIRASMVDWLTQHGAIVVPIMAYDSYKEQLAQFNNLHGFVLPGSNGPGKGYARTYKRLLRWTIRASKSKKSKRKVMGAGFCWGFQRMANYIARRTVSRGSYVAQNTNLRVKYGSNKTKSDFRISTGLTDRLNKNLQNYRLTYNNHIHGVSPETMRNNKYLRRFYDVVYTSTTLGTGKEFVALMEAKTMPLYGFQFHPEVYSRNQNQRYANAYFGKFLVNEARKNILTRKPIHDPRTVQQVATKRAGLYRFGW
uniref:folate gamma-glutamyl hydrolase n=1 Tax=Mucochytrium quahogii TaxID=96639 RepID=A0A7S2R7Y3_9STRA|mmetsp:Transcript_16065/g.26230  ORF Transcript_16065/g.26230 Transcript_16065/m.26230 type:complete len:276 (-) Transcript_16065:161-988(-)